MMKLIDKFLGKLGASRNTFATYILTLLTIYIMVDRIVEFLLMLFTGVSYSYWGPFQYTFALACPVFAFCFSGYSEFAKTKMTKVTLFNVYIIALTTIVISMLTQWLNAGVWMLLVSNPGYVELVTDFSDLIRPALTSLCIIFPVFIIPFVFKFLYFGVNDSKDMYRSIWDYMGIDLSDQKKGHGPYTCEIFVCQDYETSRIVMMPEESRFQCTFVCGGSGSGKTSLVFEPFIAKDLDRKFFFREVSKEMGFTALKSGIASLNAPYDNDYLNKNFNLNMLVPASDKLSTYTGYMKKMILDNSNGTITYRNCGVTVMSPDREISDHMMAVCDNFKLSYNIVDPSDPKSLGLNPFVYDDSSKIATTISSVIKSMMEIEVDESEERFRESVILQAIENVAILLKEMYPKMHDGMLPNLEDMLKMFSNFELVEKTCEVLAHDERLKEKYATQLNYFKKNFYKDGINRHNTEVYIDTAITQLDKLLRLPGVKTILCNRTNNINFDTALANGDVTFVCTRRGDLGAASNKAFGLFFLISMQNAVLRRPGSEKSRVPNFLYIDEFPEYISRSTEAIFTMYRKYKVGTTISAQAISQLETPNSKHNYRDVILSNCVNKIFTGSATPEELKWWVDEFGTHREWTYSNSIDTNTMTYDPKYSNVKWEFVGYFKVGKLQNMTQKDCGYKIRASNGKPQVGLGRLAYLDSKYKEPKKIKTFDFGTYSASVTTTEEEKETIASSKKKFDIKNLNFMDERNEFDPVQTDTTDSKFLFDNEDAIVVNLKGKNRPNKN